LAGTREGYSDHQRRVIATDSNLEPAARLVVLLHESAHAVVHDDLGAAEYQAHRGICETEAESTAYVLANLGRIGQPIQPRLVDTVVGVDGVECNLQLGTLRGAPVQVRSVRVGLAGGVLGRADNVLSGLAQRSHGRFILASADLYSCSAVQHDVIIEVLVPFTDKSLSFHGEEPG
jgi:uncharacterized protein DUF955